MSVFRGNIENLTEHNNNYRKVINTTKESQLVLMSLPPGDTIHREKHPSTTQFIRVEKGKCVVHINGNKRYNLADGDSVVIPSNTYHFIKNTGSTDLKLYTIYSPPEHEPGLVQKYNPDIKDEEL